MIEAATTTWAATLDYACHNLWQVIGVHIETSLRAAGVPKGAPVVIAPPRQVSVLPLHAAWRQDKNGRRHYLGDNYAITYTPSLRTLITASARRATRTDSAPSLLAIADPTGDLPSSIAEADSIARHFPGGHHKTLCGRAATTERIAEEAPAHTHLHLAIPRLV